MSCVLAVVGVLVGSGFEVSPELAAADKSVSLLSCSLLDDVIACESSAPFSDSVLCDEDLVDLLLFIIAKAP